MQALVRVGRITSRSSARARGCHTPVFCRRVSTDSSYHHLIPDVKIVDLIQPKELPRVTGRTNIKLATAVANTHSSKAILGNAVVYQENTLRNRVTKVCNLQLQGKFRNFSKGNGMDSSTPTTQRLPGTYLIVSLPFEVSNASHFKLSPLPAYAHFNYYINIHRTDKFFVHSKNVQGYSLNSAATLEAVNRSAFYSYK